MARSLRFIGTLFMMVGVSIFAPAWATDGDKVYFTIDGVTQGAITDGCLTEASAGVYYNDMHVDECLAHQFGHNVYVPLHAQSGQPNGTRVHQPLMLTKRFDKTSPLLAQALVTGESLTVEIMFYRTNSEGNSEHYYSILLDGATVISINSTGIPFSGSHGTVADYQTETVSMTYDTIRWTHEIAGTETSDTWRF